MKSHLYGYNYNLHAEFNCRKNVGVCQFKSQLSYKACSLPVGEDNNVIDLSDEHLKFSISTVTIKTAKIGMDRFVSSWN